MVTTKLNLSMTEPQVRQIYAKQGDTGRVLDIALDQTPEDGTLRILRPDGVEVTSEAVTGGEISESGETVSFESMTEADVTELTVGIEPVQDLNGYDKPWVGGAGKNKLQVTSSSRTSQGITATVNSDGSVTVNGTATGTFIFDLDSSLTLNGNYILSGCPSGGSAGTYRMDCYWSGQGALIDSGSGIAISPNGNVITTRIVVFEGVTLNNVKFYPMIRLATETDPTWQPYSNICPITGHDEVTVTDVGVNLLNYDAWKNVDVVRGTAVWENNGVTLTATSNDCFTNYGVSFPNDAKVEVTEGETITLAWDATPTNIGNVYIFPNGQTSGLVTEHSDVGHLSYTVASGVTYLTFRVGVSNSGVTASYKNIQIVRGTTVPTWTPYVAPNTYTTSLGQTVYGGTLDMVTGVLTVDKGYYKVTDVSQIGGSGSQSGTYPKWILSIGNFPNVDPSYYDKQWLAQDAVISNMGVMVRESISLNTNETTMSVYFHANAMEVRPRPLVSEFPTLEEAKQVYVGAEFVYPIVPTTYQLTAQQIKTLIGTNNVWASSGDIVSIKFAYGGLLSELPSDATSIVGKCYCDVEQNGVSSMPFTLNVKKNERAT